MGPKYCAISCSPGHAFIYEKNLGNQKMFSVNKEVNEMLGIFQGYVATEQGLFGLECYLFRSST